MERFTRFLFLINFSFYIALLHTPQDSDTYSDTWGSDNISFPRSVSFGSIILLSNCFAFEYDTRSSCLKLSHKSGIRSFIANTIWRNLFLTGGFKIQNPRPSFSLEFAMRKRHEQVRSIAAFFWLETFFFSYTYRIPHFFLYIAVLLICSYNI